MTSHDQRDRARRRYGRGDIRTGNAGHSSAAWIGVAVILAGCVVAAVALPMDRPWLFWTGIGVAAVGAVLGKVLSMFGFGVPPGYHQEGDAELRDRYVAASGSGADGPLGGGGPEEGGGAQQWSAERDAARRRR
ncbi:HGxxPAAW family protein [Yinghuangia sp. YIM S09857]|uniref:HGxxPAAW family protein n=1 Tax=Yinghuangia sp. YIM S09857 TaxID=3436929 RepID=UPI003F53A223